MPYRPSNTLIRVSIVLASLSFAYTIPLFPLAFPFHIITIIAYASTCVYHTFLLWAASLKRPFSLKIALDADPDAGQQVGTTLFSVHSTAVLPSSGLGIMLSFGIAALWTGAAISRMVYMIIHWTDATAGGLMSLVLEAAVTTYIAGRGVTYKLNDKTPALADWQAATMRSIDDIFMRLGQLQTAISTPMDANVEHAGSSSNELRERSGATVSKERKDI